MVKYQRQLDATDARLTHSQQLLGQIAQKTPVRLGLSDMAASRLLVLDMYYSFQVRSLGSIAAKLVLPVAAAIALMLALARRHHHTQAMKAGAQQGRKSEWLHGQLCAFPCTLR